MESDLSTFCQQQSIKKVIVNPVVLLKILKLIENSNKKQWGKLVGTFDIETGNMFIEKMYCLDISKLEEKFRREDHLEELIFKSTVKGFPSFRIVGFFILSEEFDIVSSKIIEQLLNTEKYGESRVLLHASILKSVAGLNPFNFYTLSNEFLLCNNSNLNPENVLASFNSSSISNLKPCISSFYNKLEFEVSENILLKLIIDLNPQLSSQLIEKSQILSNSQVDPIKRIQSILTSQTNNFNNNKLKTSKKISSMINALGSIINAKETIENCKEINTRFLNSVNQIHNIPN